MIRWGLLSRRIAGGLLSGARACYFSKVLAAQAVVDFMAHLERSGASASTVRQRSWALHKAHYDAAELLGVDPEELDVADLVATSTVERITSGCPTPTARAIGASLRAMADHLGTDIPAHTRPPAEVTVPLPPRAARDLAGLVDIACRRTPVIIRAQAIIALFGSHRWARGQVLGLQRSQVTPTLGLPTTVQTPTGAVLTLPEHASERVNAWCHLRDTLTAELEGTIPTSLWVGVAPTHAPDGRVYPAGMPLRARGMERAHTNMVRRVNKVLEARPELRPSYLFDRAGQPVDFPTSLQALRRAGVSSRSGTFAASG